MPVFNKGKKWFDLLDNNVFSEKKTVTQWAHPC